MNTANGYASTVGGGYINTADGAYSSVGGGYGNDTSANYATVGGGKSNSVSGAFSTVGGGESNAASGEGSTISGGYNNIASGVQSTLSGGFANDATGESSTIGGGSNNAASDTYSTVGGGYHNEASGESSTVGGGYFNTASGSNATVSGGASSLAEGDYSFAAGRRAKAYNAGSFVWGDSTDANVASSANNQFTARASGGVRFYSNSGMTTGVSLAAGGGSWTAVSDRNEKQNLSPVDGREVLDKVAELPLSTWNYKTQDPSIRHMGPMAQDLYAAFGLGETDKGITTIDADGVALAAIQGLDQRLKETRQDLAERDREIIELKAELGAMKSLLEKLASKQ